MAANRSSALNGENGTISKSKDGSSLQPVSGIHSTLLQQLSSLPVIMSAQPVIQKNSQLPFGQKPQSSQQQQTQTQQQQTQQQMQQRQQPPLAPHNQQHNQATVQLQQIPQLTSIPASSIMSGLTLLPVSAAAGVSQKNQDAKTVQPGFFLVQSSAVCSAKSGDLGNALTKSTPLFILSPSSVQPQLLLQGQQMQQTLPSSVVSLSSGQNFVISAEMLSQLQKPQQIQQLILPDTVSNFSMPIVTTTMTAPESTSNDTHFSTPSTELKIETAGSMQPESEKVELEDLEKFAKVFKQRRVELGYTQGDIGLALGKLHGNDFSQTTISRFEALNLSFNNMCKLKPLLQKWLDVADAMAAPAHPNSEGNDPSDSNSRRRKHRTSIDSAIRAVLERNFQENSKPTSAQLRAWADSLHLDKEVVRIWFCNRRQKDKRINLPLLSSSSVGASIPSICSEADAVVTVPPASRSSRIEPIAIFPIVAGSVNSFQS